MIKKSIIFFVILAVIAIVSLAYYYLIYKPAQVADATFMEGASCTIDGKAGKVVNGVCVPAPRGATSSGVPFFKVGDNIYLNKDYSHPSLPSVLDIGVYSSPVATGPNLLGIVRKDWYPGVPIGTFIENAGTDFYKIKVNNLQTWEYKNGFTTTIKKQTGDIYILKSAVSQLP